MSVQCRYSVGGKSRRFLYVSALEVQILAVALHMMIFRVGIIAEHEHFVGIFDCFCPGLCPLPGFVRARRQRSAGSHSLATVRRY